MRARLNEDVVAIKMLHKPPHILDVPYISKPKNSMAHVDYYLYTIHALFISECICTHAYASLTPKCILKIL